MAMPQNLKPTITPFLTSPSVSLKTQNSSLFFGTITSTSDNYRTQTPPFSFKTRTNSQFFSTRRLFLPSVSGIWDALTSGNNAREAVAAIRHGMVLFRQGDVSGSVAEFDKAIELDPRQQACLKKGQSSSD
ncbi:hypothetical protein GBA52_018759 [Prunus armeniaca]|nr:hypothetical protein GBA52_018759 [Prunus armeniaca]